MKTAIPFNLNIPVATIVVKTAKADKYRAILTELHEATIDREQSNEEGFTVFKVVNMKLKDLPKFDKNNAEECFVHYYELRQDNIRAKFYSTDTSRPMKRIKTISVEMVYEKDDEDRSRGIAEIYDMCKEFGGPVTKYTVNWGAWGSVDLETVETFAKGINIALELAKECTEQFVEK